VPVIQEPILEEIPTHEPWQFTAIDESNYLLSEKDLKELTTYIINLKDYGNAGWIWTQYYIDELARITEEFKQ